MAIHDGKPMRYIEVGQGAFDKMMQQSFLKAHKLASEYNQRVEVQAKITIYPPDPRLPTSGNHSFEVSVKEPKYTSQRFTTSLSGGLPISDGRDMADATQIDVFTPVVVDYKQTKPEVIDDTACESRPRLSDVEEPSRRTDRDHN